MVIVLLMGLITYMDIRRERAVFREGLAQRGMLLASSLNAILANHMYFAEADELGDIAKVVTSQPEIEYFRIFRPDGTLMVSEPDDGGQSEYATGYVDDAFRSVIIQEGQPISQFQDHTAQVVSPIMSGGDLLGVVHFGFNADARDAEIRSIILEHVGQALALIVLGVALAYLIGRYLSRSIGALATVAREIGQGNLDVIVPSRGTKEAVELSDSLERMRSELQALHGGFERRVAQRTEELSRSTEELKAEVAERQRTEEEARGLAAENQLVAEVGRIITSSLDIDEVYAQFASRVQRVVDFDRISVNLIDDVEGTVITRHLAGLALPQRESPNVRALVGSQTEQLVAWGCTIVRDDADPDSPFPVERASTRAGLRSSIRVPLVSKGAIIGSLALRSRQPGAYGPQEQRIIERLAAQIAPAIDNADLYEQSKRAEAEALQLAAENAAMAEIGRIINSSLDIVDIYQRFADEIGKLLSFDWITVNSISIEDDTLTLCYNAGDFDIPVPWRNAVIPLRGTFTQAVAGTTSGLIVQPEDPNEIAGRYPGLAPLVQDGFLSFLGVPLISRGRVIATLHMVSRRPSAYVEKDLELTARVGAQIAGAIVNSALYEESLLAEEAQRARNLELQALFSIASTLAGPEGFEETCKGVLRELSRISQAERVFLRVPDEMAQGLRLVAAAGQDVDEVPPKALIPYGEGISGQAFQDGQTIVANDYRSHPRARPDIVDYGVRSEASLPIKAGGQSLAVVVLSSREANHFTTERVRLLTAVADELGVLLENAKLSQDLSAGKEEMAAIDEVARIITTNLNIQQVYDQFASEVNKLVAFDRIYINLVDHTAGTSSAKYISGMAEAGLEVDQVRPLSKTQSEVVVRTSESLVRRDIAEDPRFHDDQTHLALGLRSAIALPLISKGVVIGTLGLRSREVGAYGSREQVILERLAAQIAPAIENASLYDRSKQAEAVERQLSAENQLVAEVGRIIGASLDIKQVYERFASRVREHISFDYMSVSLIDVEDGVSISAYVSGIDVPGRRAGDRIALIGSLTNEVILSRSSRLIDADSVAELRRQFPVLVPALDSGLRSFMAVPLMTGDEPIAVLNMRSTQPKAYTDRDLRLLEQVGRQIAPAIENAQLFDQLQEGQERLRNLSRQLVEVQEQERRHVARELHDEIGQVLTGLKLTLEVVPRLGEEAGKAKVEQAKTMVNDLMVRVRELSLDLRPAMLDDLGLLPTLLWHFERFTATTRVKVSHAHVGLDRRFRPEVETTAYRIVQEALTNVARHAGTNAVTVRIRSDRDNLLMDIHDHGAGFDPDAVLANPQSHGIYGMRERAMLLGGQLTLETAQGDGTRLIAELPLGDWPVTNGKLTNQNGVGNDGDSTSG